MKLITGGTGLLGSAFAKISDDVRLLGTKDCDLLHDDLYNLITPDIDCVIHCAAMVGGVQANINKQADFFTKNMKMNMNVFDACKRRDVKLVSVMSTCIYLSSIELLGPILDCFLMERTNQTIRHRCYLDRH